MAKVTLDDLVEAVSPSVQTKDSTKSPSINDLVNMVSPPPKGETVTFPGDAPSEGDSVTFGGDMPSEEDMDIASEVAKTPGSLEPGQKGFLVRTTIGNKILKNKIQKVEEATAASVKDSMKDVIGVDENVARDVREAYNKAEKIAQKTFGTTLKVIEKFQIPQQMLFNSLKRVQEGKISYDDFAEGIVNAVRGKEGTTTKMLFDKAINELGNAGYLSPLTVKGIKQSAVYKTIAFGSDILVDPLFLFGSGTTKAGKLSRIARSADEIGTGIKLDSRAAKMIADYYGAGKPTEELMKQFPRWAGTAGEQVDLGQRAFITFLGRPAIRGKSIIQATDALTTKLGHTKAVNTVRNLFSTNTGNKAVDEILFKTQQAYNYAGREGVEQGVEIAERLKDVDQNQINLISKILDEGLDYRVVKNPEMMGQRLAKSRKGKKSIYGVSEPVGAVIEDLRNEFRLMADAERSLGVLNSELNFYFPRIPTEDGLKLLKEGKFDLRDFDIMPKNMQLKFAGERKTAKFTLDEYNNMMGDKFKIAEFFTKDPAVAYAIRRQSHLRAMSQAEMWDDVVEKFAIKDPTSPAYKTAKEAIGVGRVSGFRFDPHVAEAIQKMNRVVNDPTNVKEIYGNWKVLTDWWKGWTLGIFPEYHFRNSVSNYWNNWLAGVDNPGYYMDGMKVLKGSNGSLKTVTGHTWTYDQIRKLAKQYGVEGTGWYGAEIPEYIRNRVAQGKQFETIGGALKSTFTSAPEGADVIARTAGKVKALATPTRENQLLKLGFAVGRGIENNARMAHFLYQLKQGRTPLEAAQSVAKYLFDYSDLTRFEKHVKQFLPFMKWSKENIPLQFVNLFKQPWKYTMVSKGREAFFEQGEVFQSVYPEVSQFIANNTPIRFNKTKEGDHEYFLLGGYWPASSIQQMINPRDTLMNLLHPAWSHTMNVGKFLEYASPRAAREYAAEQQEEVKFIGVPMSRSFANKMRVLRLLSSGDNFYRTMNEFATEKESSAVPTKAILKTLTGIKSYKTSPAKDVMYKKVQERDILRRKYERAKNYKKEATDE